MAKNPSGGPADLQDELKTAMGSLTLRKATRPQGGSVVFSNSKSANEELAKHVDNRRSAAEAGGSRSSVFSEESRRSVGDASATSQTNGDSTTPVAAAAAAVAAGNGAADAGPPPELSNGSAAVGVRRAVASTDAGAISAARASRAAVTSQLQELLQSRSPRGAPVEQEAASPTEQQQPPQ